MMASHNELNGVQMHMNAEIMTQLFRGTYQYEGFFGEPAFRDIVLSIASAIVMQPVMTIT